MFQKFHLSVCMRPPLSAVWKRRKRRDHCCDAPPVPKESWPENKRFYCLGDGSQTAAQELADISGDKPEDKRMDQLLSQTCDAAVITSSSGSIVWQLR